MIKAMDKQAFTKLFEEAIERALELARERFKREFPPDMLIELHGAGHSKFETDFTSSVDILYLAPEKFYRIIDVAVLRVDDIDQFTTFFVCASGHPPSSFEDTWNTPPGAGPFKAIVAKELRDKDN